MKTQSTLLDRVRIRSTGSYTPARVVTNQELVDRGIDTTPEWIANTLGISERRIAAADEHTSDLAAQAGVNAIRNAGIGRNDIDMVIVATSTPDRKCPSTACITQAKMGITNRCPAFDVAAVCSGFVYGLMIAGQFVQCGTYERILVIGADAFSKITDWGHRNCVFFGDGAGAVVVEKTSNNFFAGLLYADGMGMDHFTVYPDDETFTMNGRAVYETATEVLPCAMTSLLRLHNRSFDDVKMIIPHQPSLRVLKTTAERLEIPFSKVQCNLRRHANTAGATVPLLLDQVNQQQLLEPGDQVLFAAVGAGWTWGAILYQWQ
jgi:3-oxoacyl-[acyl-carrier-protein] synthase-3